MKTWSRYAAIGAVAITATALISTAAGAADVHDITAHGGATRLAGDQTASVRNAAVDGPAKNVILIIGDGMGDSEITIARDYIKGAAGRFEGIDALPMTGSYTTYSLDKKNGKPDYVTDSAASGSGWATGTKTYNNAISVDVNGKPQETILELAKRNGLKTGNVTTAELQDATPAVLASHVSKRSCYGPDETTKTCPEAALENGGLGSITEQMLNVRADVTFGGGAKTFNQTAKAGDYKGKTLLDQAKQRGYSVISTNTEMQAVSKADDKAPVLGLFAPGNLPTAWEGPQASHEGGKQAPVTCNEVNSRFTAETPRLDAMTTKAIDLLNTSERGFFLQVESASIDKADHAADACGQIGETAQLDEATKAALDFAKKDGNTLVIVTADHAHSSQVIYPNTTTPGLTLTLLTHEGQPMTVAYGTAEQDGSQAHTGTQVRVAAYGPGAANFVGLTDQTDTFFTMARMLKLKTAPETPATTPGAPTTAPTTGAPTTAPTTAPAPTASETATVPASASVSATAPAGGDAARPGQGGGTSAGGALADTGAQNLWPLFGAGALLAAVGGGLALRRSRGGSRGE